MIWTGFFNTTKYLSFGLKSRATSGYILFSDYFNILREIIKTPEKLVVES